MYIQNFNIPKDREVYKKRKEKYQKKRSNILWGTICLTIGVKIFFLL